MSLTIFQTDAMTPPDSGAPGWTPSADYRRVVDRTEHGATAVDGCLNKYVGPRAAGPVLYPGYVEVCYLVQGDHTQLLASGELIDVPGGTFAIRYDGATSYVITPESLTSVCFFSPGRPADWPGRGAATSETVKGDPVYIDPKKLDAAPEPETVTGTARTRVVLSYSELLPVNVRWTEMDAGARIGLAASAEDRILYLVEGSVRLTDAAGEHGADAGAFVQWPAGEALTIAAEGAATYFTVGSPDGVASA
ncbi:hypothetical protein AGRA3207_005554 [Actinomadura graeca]|uniref:DUF861 domain-containing protein n=1 Tax=Actinomadura graeca TaxID=2750812 RepID=A0ABX8QZJ5_9ACTN|nr:hypothetical protein [Actinomadura graeca]QXJ24265.1 hypothetical protein AGRA3207_005554 [Actinomadura graeca]